jgi:endonuclease III
MIIDDETKYKLDKLKQNFEQDKPQSLLNPINMSPYSRSLVEKNNFALLVAVIADQSVKSELAWNLPYELSMRIGADHLNPNWIIRNIETVQEAIKQKPALHRFPKKITDYIFSLSSIIQERYQSADQLLNGSLDYHTFVSSIKEVSGISDKKANFLFLILVLDFNHPFVNREQSNVLFDSHLENWLSRYFNRKISKSEANQICKEVSPDNPALLCPYLWNLDRKPK